jgi:hypothetical protein
VGRHGRADGVGRHNRAGEASGKGERTRGVAADRGGPPVVE